MAGGLPPPARGDFGSREGSRLKSVLGPGLCGGVSASACPAARPAVPAVSPPCHVPQCSQLPCRCDPNHE
eukprot:6476206-Lingulodinium_polyedra.AAC.1